jgi:hypothetical protein
MFSNSRNQTKQPEEVNHESITLNGMLKYFLSNLPSHTTYLQKQQINL